MYSKIEVSRCNNDVTVSMNNKIVSVALKEMIELIQ
jgi:hypothetical protein